MNILSFLVWLLPTSKCEFKMIAILLYNSLPIKYMTFHGGSMDLFVWNKTKRTQICVYVCTWIYDNRVYLGVKSNNNSIWSFAFFNLFSKSRDWWLVNYICMFMMSRTSAFILLIKSTEHNCMAPLFIAVSRLIRKPLSSKEVYRVRIERRDYRPNAMYGIMCNGIYQCKMKFWTPQACLNSPKWAV